jgi:hypothetical protein
LLSCYDADDADERYNLGILKANPRWFDWKPTARDPLFTAAFGTPLMQQQQQQQAKSAGCAGDGDRGWSFYASGSMHGTSDLTFDPLVHWRMLHHRGRVAAKADANVAYVPVYLFSHWQMYEGEVGGVLSHLMRLFVSDSYREHY